MSSPEEEEWEIKVAPNPEIIEAPKPAERPIQEPVPA